MNRIAAAVSLIALTCGLGTITNAQTVSASAKESAKIAIDRLIEKEMASRGIPGLQIAIVRHGKMVFTGAYGKANIENSIPVTEKTVFPINSISKAFAGVAAMQLVEAGMLDLDAPVETYLDQLPTLWAGITVRQLLTHSSGLPEIVDDNVRLIDGAEPDAAWAMVQKLPLKFSPGARFSYTQTNYLVVGKIIEKLTARSFADFVRDRQFEVAGMGRTRFDGSAKAPRDVASQYTYLRLLTEGTKTVGAERSESLMARDEKWPEYLRPAAGIQATSKDLARWIIALQKLKLINKDSFEQMSSPRPLKNGSYGGFSSVINGYALGWPSARRAAHPALTPVGGERAAMFVYPEDDLTVIVLTNLMGASPQTFIDRIASIYIPGLMIGEK